MIVRSARGVLVDTTGPVIKIEGDISINFGLLRGMMLDPQRTSLAEAICDYVRDLIKRHAPTSVSSYFYSLRTVVDRPAAVDALLAGGPSTLGHVYDAMPDLEAGWARRCVSVVRRFYTWCVDAGLSGFDADTSIAMDRVVVGGQRAGVAILRADPDDGPLSEPQARALEHAFWQAVDETTLPLNQAAAAAICLFLGSNPETLRRLDEQDLVAPCDNRGWLLYVPRIKKGRTGRGRRSAFKKRELDPRVGELLSRLVKQNRCEAPLDSVADAIQGRPLFRRPKPAAGLVGTAHESDATRAYHSFVYRAIADLPSRLASIDALVGKLKLSPRRLRYTFATRCVRNGATVLQLMELLDHSSPMILYVYYNSRLDLCNDLNAKLGSTLDVVAALFMGSVSVDELYNTQGFAGTSRPTPAAPDACRSCPLFRPITVATNIKQESDTGTPHSTSSVAGSAPRKTNHEASDGKSSPRSASEAPK